MTSDEQIAVLREALEQCLIDDDHGEGLERSTRVAARQALDATAQPEQDGGWLPMADIPGNGELIWVSYENNVSITQYFTGDIGLFLSDIGEQVSI